MSTLIRIPAGHMRFVPAHKQADEATPTLHPAKWPVEFFLIANPSGREAFLSHDRINQIMCPTIRATCALAQEHTQFFPSPPLTRGTYRGRLASPPRRLLLAEPATPARPPHDAGSPKLDNLLDTPPPHIGDHRKEGDPSGTSDGSGSSPTGTISRTMGVATPPANRCPTLRVKRISPPHLMERPRPTLARPQCHIPGNRNTFRNNGSTPTAQILRVTPA